MGGLRKNYFFQVTYQILNMILPFITSPYISRVLGADKLGIYSYVYSVASIFVLFINLGISNYGNRGVATRKGDSGELSRFVSELLVLRAIIGLIPIASYFIAVIFFWDNKAIYFIQGMILVAAVIDINWIFFGLEQFKITVTRNFAVKILTVVCIFVFVKDEDDLWKYTLIMTLGSCISQSVVWLFLFKYINLVRVKLVAAFQHIGQMLLLFIAVLANSAYTYVDKVMVGSLGSMEQLGFCENAYKMISFPMGVITALETVMLPRMSSLYSNGNAKSANGLLNVTMEYSLAVSSAMMFGLVSVADCFSSVFWGSDFLRCGSIMMVAAPSCLFMTWNGVIRSCYLIPCGYDRVYSFAIVLGAIVNLVLDAILIPFFGAEGAALAMTLAYFSIALYQTNKMRKQIPYKDMLFRAVPFILFGIVMFLCVKVVAHFCDGYSLFSLIAEVAAGVTVYCILAFLYLICRKGSFFSILLNRRDGDEQ